MAIQYGYARVSSQDQKLGRQIDALREFGVRDMNVYVDKASGKDFQRPAYQRLKRRLKEGDVLVVKSIDRLGRNMSDILEIMCARHSVRSYLDIPIEKEKADALSAAIDEAAMLAPTAMNQQSFFIRADEQRAVVSIENKGGFYSKVDLGIVKHDFQAAAGASNFTWS